MAFSTMVCLLAQLLAQGPGDLSKQKIIDLTHSFNEQTLYWPTANTFQLKEVFTGVTDKGFYYEAYEYCAAEHGGTHLDAPIHFAKDRWTVEEIPLNRLMGPMVKIDVSAKCRNNRDYQVGPQDFQAWEKEHGRLPDGIIVLLDTGSAALWPDAVTYLGTAERGAEAVAKLHFPGLHPDGATWLVSQRRIHAIGIDTPSIDYGQSVLFRSHQILFKANIPAFENVANLSEVPAKGAQVIALPMKISKGSGGPLRITAILP